MSRGFSEEQSKVIDELKDGAILHAYRSSKDGLRAFVSFRKEGVSRSRTIRVDTLLALYRKNAIKRKKKLDWDDWAGVWTLKT